MTIRRRASALMARVRAGEGREIIADLGERIERWLASGRVPLPSPLRTPVEQLGELVGDLARATRPPRPGPPPAAGAPETAGEREEVTPERAGVARERPRGASHRAGAAASRGREPERRSAAAPAGAARPKPSAASAEAPGKQRVSARRAAPAKRARAEAQVVEIASEPARKHKKATNGKGRRRRPAARRKRDDETEEPT